MTAPSVVSVVEAARSVLRRRRRQLLLSVCALAALGVLVATPAVRHQIALSFSRQTTPYVALYFADTPVTVRGDEVGVVFTIAGHDESDAHYSYRVELVDSAGATLIATGSTVTGDGSPAEEVVPFTLAHGATWAHVAVRIDGRPESINVTNPSLRSAAPSP